ncbi:MAG: YncE family protein [Gammaproteobacteria bacterium]|jgi:DNA-binding beta-propeller fold protein YncE
MRTRFHSLSLTLSLVSGALICGTAAGQGSVDALVERGQELFHADIGCRVCHAETGEGLIGPSLHFGPTPVDIFDQLESNPVMGVIVSEMDPSDEDLVAISMYIRILAGLPLDADLPGQWRTALATVKANQAKQLEFAKTDRDLQVEAIETFESVQATWTRRAVEGSVESHYQTEVVATFDPGEPKFQPQPGKTYFYENVGTTSSPSILFEGYVSPTSNQIVVGDAETMEVIASYMLPQELRAVVHTSLMSPDGRYVYIIGARPGGDFDTTTNLSTSATLIKADAITLQPISQITIGGRLHHGQVFRDYVMLDMFARDPDGLAINLMDPETDEIVGGVRDVDMGGYVYTAWTDKDYEYIYALMEPAGYAPGRSTGMFGAISMYQGRLMAMRPFWIAKIDPDTWEVVAEFPIPGYRPNWLIVDSAKENMYVINTLSNASKINIETGAIQWTNGTGIGPYGGSLNADETELWVADKGEAAGHLGRTITVMDSISGHAIETLYGGYKVDHVLLSPNGKEMWATSNGEGRLYVYDVETKDLLKVIDMPGNGDAHGLIWVHYDENGEPRVVRDQGNFHGGVNPMTGNALDY